MSVVRKLTSADADETIRMLARAFEDDPFVHWLVRKDARHEEGMRAFFEAALHGTTLPFGECYTTDGIDGAALWNPPDTWNLNLFGKIRLAPDFARATGLSRLLHVFFATNPLTAAHPHDPHFYLFVLGVDQAKQRRGIGRRLVEPVLRRCDDERIAAYLETSNPENLVFYRSLGFAEVGAHTIPDGPTVWFLRREPRP